MREWPSRDELEDLESRLRIACSQVASYAGAEGRTASPDAYAGMALVAVLEWIEAAG